jgi:hypothetical protein
VAERSDPRAAFDGHVLDTPWDMLHLAYFLGYALWNYLTTPFSFAQPGYLSEELEPWRENGQTWRRLKVKFPAHIATHCAEQVFFFDADGLLRRHDYIAGVVGPGAAAHYTSEYREFDGIMVPTRRRVYPVDAKGNVANEPFLVQVRRHGASTPLSGGQRSVREDRRDPLRDSPQTGEDVRSAIVI